MGYLGRRIGLSQDNGDSNPGAAGGAVGGGLLDLFAHGYFERQGDLYNAPGLGPVSGLTATGGIVSDYVSGSEVYRAHVFTSSGALNVTDTTSNFGATVEYLVVAGGGAGGQSGPNGYGGAGDILTKFGVSVRDELIVTISKERFEDFIAPFMAGQDDGTDDSIMPTPTRPVSYTHLTLPTNREV